MEIVTKSAKTRVNRVTAKWMFYCSLKHEYNRAILLGRLIHFKSQHSPTRLINIHYICHYLGNHFRLSGKKSSTLIGCKKFYCITNLSSFWTYNTALFTFMSTSTLYK